MSDCKPAPTPMVTSPLVSASGDSDLFYPTTYRSLVGAL
jgi:hypothetical protein